MTLITVILDHHFSKKLMEYNNGFLAIFTANNMETHVFCRFTIFCDFGIYIYIFLLVHQNAHRKCSHKPLLPYTSYQ